MENSFKYDATFKIRVILSAEKIGNRAAGRKYTVSEECVRHWQSINTKLFSCLTNRKTFYARKGIHSETDASVLGHFKNLRNKVLPTNTKAAMSKTLKGINILEVKSVLQTTVQIFCICLTIIPKISKGKIKCQ
jgi:hypothetical protein